MIGRVLYLLLENSHLLMVKEELLLRQIPFNYSWGVKSLCHTLKDHKETESACTNAFFPHFIDADQWLTPEEVEIEVRKVRYSSLRKAHIQYACDE